LSTKSYSTLCDVTTSPAFVVNHAVEKAVLTQLHVINQFERLEKKWPTRIVYVESHMNRTNL